MSSDVWIVLAGLLFSAIFTVVLALSARLSLGLRVLAIVGVVAVNGGAVTWHFLLDDGQRQNLSERWRALLDPQKPPPIDWESLATRCGRLLRAQDPRGFPELTGIPPIRTGSTDAWSLTWTGADAAGPRTTGCTGRGLAILTVDGRSVEADGMTAPPS